MANESCDYWEVVFSEINNYFRKEDVYNGTDFASTEFGYLITFAYIFVIVFGSVGNLLTILVILMNPTMRTTRNFFILNLAFSDFFVCTVTAPITLYTVLYLFWPYGMVSCKVAGSLQGFSVYLSTFSIAAIALDRYVLVIFPTKRERQQNLALAFFFMIWTTALVLAIPLFIASDLKTIHKEECGLVVYMCHEQNYIWEQMWISKKTYTMCALATHYAFPLCSAAFAYSRIAHRMKMRFSGKNSAHAHMVSSQRRRSVVERQRRTNLLLICIVAVFAVAWLPLNVFHIANTFELSTHFSVCAFAICHIMGIFSSCLNPLIYAFFNQNFRLEFLSLFDRAGLGCFRQCFTSLERRFSGGSPLPSKGVPSAIGYETSRIDMEGTPLTVGMVEASVAPKAAAHLSP